VDKASYIGVIDSINVSVSLAGIAFVNLCVLYTSGKLFAVSIVFAVWHSW